MRGTDSLEKILMLERLKWGGEGDDRGWDGWMASLTQWKWVWVNSGSWWWTWRPGMLQSMGLQRVQHNLATELNLLNDLIIDHSHYSFNVKTDSSLANAVPSSWVVWVFDLILRVLGHFLVFWQDVPGSCLHCCIFLAWDPNSIISPRNTVSFIGNGI